MIRIEYNIELPKDCYACPLIDDEFDYCHGHLEAKAWELSDTINDHKRPDWCPLIEVRKSCKECSLVALYETCTQKHCINYSFRKKKEEKLREQITDVLKQMEKKYET